MYIGTGINLYDWVAHGLPKLKPPGMTTSPGCPDAALARPVGLRAAAPSGISVASESATPMKNQVLVPVDASDTYVTHHP